MLTFVFFIMSTRRTRVRTFEYGAANEDDVVWTSAGVTNLQVG